MSSSRYEGLFSSSVPGAEELRTQAEQIVEQMSRLATSGQNPDQIQ
jgi:hypothetical protein